MSWVKQVFSRRRLYGDLSAEIRGHLEEKVEELVAGGMSRKEATYAARREFGNVTLIEEDSRTVWRWPSIGDFFIDVRYGLRMLAKSPIFTVVAVLTLAFGIGLNTTLFSVVNAVALKPIPVRDSGRIVRLERWFANNLHGDSQYAFSYEEFRYFAKQNRVFSSLIATSFPLRVTASLPLDPAAARLAKTLIGPLENATAQMVSANYFAELGAAPALGRGFRADEGEIAGADPVVVLSYPYWQTRFGSDALILGKVLKINDTAFTVIGVAPREFVGTGNPPVMADFYAPLAMQAQVVPGQDWLNQPLDYEIQLLGYLAPTAAMKQADADMSVLEQRFAQEHPNPENKTTAITVQRATFFGNTEDWRFRAIVTLLMVIVGMVLVIACANLANMLLAKASGRQREVAVRRAVFALGYSCAMAGRRAVCRVALGLCHSDTARRASLWLHAAAVRLHRSLIWIVASVAKLATRPHDLAQRRGHGVRPAVGPLAPARLVGRRTNCYFHAVPDRRRPARTWPGAIAGSRSGLRSAHGLSNDIAVQH
ncbi:MAG: hypothetical protein DME36_03565 [Verrucomicrobia bacterium]|nr:MAG: hypothetical protein DME36_03565 [Verrucomicrobiota bacterium]